MLTKELQRINSQTAKTKLPGRTAFGNRRIDEHFRENASEM
jgi:hypothetical protein